MRLAVDLQERLLRYLTTILLPLRLFLHPVSLQDTEYNNIKALIYVGGVRRIAKDMDLLSASIVKELEGVVRVMAIDNQQASMSVHFPLCVPIEVF